MNDFIVRATALALTDVPRANSQWDAKSGEVVPCQSVDISIAVATDKGLITPIVKDANKKSLTQISAEVSHCRCCRLPAVNSLSLWNVSARPAQAGTCAEHCRATSSPAHLKWHSIVYGLHMGHGNCLHFKSCCRVAWLWLC